MTTKQQIISLLFLLLMTGCTISRINKDTGKSWIIGIGEHKQGDASISCQPLDLPDIKIGG